MSDLLSNYTYEEPTERDFVTFEKGEYPFKFIEINEPVEKPGKHPYIPIKLEFTRPDGATTQVYENLVFAPTMKWKLDQFVKCTCGTALPPGRGIDWRDINFTRWLLNRTGRAVLDVEPIPEKTYSRNRIASWCYDKTATAAPAPARPPAPSPAPFTPVDDHDDEPIPF